MKQEYLKTLDIGHSGNSPDEAMTILETTVDVEIVSKQRHHLYDVFDLGGGDVLQPLEANTKPHLYYLQHDDGNVQVLYNVQPYV